MPSDDGALDVAASAPLPLVTDASAGASRRDATYELTGRPQCDEMGAEGGTCAVTGRDARNTPASPLAVFLGFIPQHRV